MSIADPHPLADARMMVRQLRDLATLSAPPTVLPAVLERLGQSDAYACCKSPIGPVYVAYNGLGISAVMSAASATAFEEAFRARFERPVRQATALPDQLARSWAQLWTGKIRSAPEVDLRGLTGFERSVLEKAREIPRGEMRPYAWIAREIGRPKAVRAVGTALRRNPVPLLIPCHRIGRSDGRVGNYAFGAPAKQAVLAFEGVNVGQMEELAQAGVRYYGSDTTHIYCFPTCRHARRITDAHRVLLRSEATAIDAGYRPCKVCRPAVAA
jgi:O-6-methylguanine DNA methyltransferase